MRLACTDQVAAPQTLVFMHVALGKSGPLWVGMHQPRLEKSRSSSNLALDGVDKRIRVERLGDEAAGAVGEHRMAGLFLAVGR